MAVPWVHACLHVCLYAGMWLLSSPRASFRRDILTPTLLMTWWRDWKVHLKMYFTENLSGLPVLSPFSQSACSLWSACLSLSEMGWVGGKWAYRICLLVKYRLHSSYFIGILITMKQSKWFFSRIMSDFFWNHCLPLSGKHGDNWSCVIYT